MRYLPPIQSVDIQGQRLLVNGEPFFSVTVPLCYTPKSRSRDAIFADMPTNTVTTHTSDVKVARLFRVDVDRAFSQGRYALCAFAHDQWKRPHEIEQIVKACRDAPGLLAYKLTDEPNIRDNPGPRLLDQDLPRDKYPYITQPALLEPIYQLIKRLDPVHPVWLNLAYGLVKDHEDYAHVSDIQSDDVFPVPTYTMVHVAQASDAVTQGFSGPGWMYLQISGAYNPVESSDVRCPTIEEVRCMTYMAIAHGMTGIVYMPFHAGEWWEEQGILSYVAQLEDLIAELRLLSPALIAPEVPKLIAEIIEGHAGNHHFGYTALHTSLRRTANGYFLIAVNAAEWPIKARFQVSVPIPGLVRQAAVRSERRMVDVQDGVFEDTFDPVTVHLYEIPFREPQTQP